MESRKLSRGSNQLSRTAQPPLSVGASARLLQPHRLANAIAEEVQLGPPHDAAALDLDLGDLAASAAGTSAPPLRRRRCGARRTSRGVPEPLRAITTPLKIWIRSFSPSRIRVCTSTVSPILNSGTSVLQAALFDELQVLLTHGSYPFVSILVDSGLDPSGGLDAVAGGLARWSFEIGVVFLARAAANRPAVLASLMLCCRASSAISSGGRR